MMELKDLIANLMLNDMTYGSQTAKITIEIDLDSLDMKVDTENIFGVSELISYLQYCAIENLKAAGVKEKQAQDAFDIKKIISTGYSQPNYLILNGKSFKEEK